MFKKIAQAIKEMKTINCDLDEHGYPNIHWVIADFMLRDLSDYDKHIRLSGYVAQVKNLLNKSLSYLEDKGCKTFVVVPDGRRNIACITIDEDDARLVKEDERRCKNYAKKYLSGALRQLEHKHPIAYEQLLHAQRALPELGEG